MASTPAPLPSLGLLDGLGEPATPVDDRQGVIEHPLPMAWHADPGHAAAYAWYALGVLVANRDEVSPPPPPPPPATDSSGGAAYLPHIGLLLEGEPGPPPPPSGGSGGAAFLPHIGLLLEASTPPPPPPAPAPSTSAGGRNYIIKGRRYYNLTNEELAYLLANELIDVQRADIRVQYGNKDRRITRGDFAAIVKQAKAPQAVKAAALAWDDEEEAAMLLL